MVLDILRIAAPFVVGYLVGGIPWSLIVGRRFYGIDLREHGSCNLGATNVYRVLGARPALAVAALDVAKGSAAVALAMLTCPPSVTGDARDFVLIGVAMVSVLGHTYSPYIRFKGGKGVATAAGAIAVVMPLVWPILFAVFVLVIWRSRMVSLGSITVATIFPVLTWIIYGDRMAFVIFSLVAAALVIGKHRTNIVRIWRGEESRISFSGRGSASKVLFEESDAPQGTATPGHGSDRDDRTGSGDTEE